MNLQNRSGDTDLVDDECENVNCFGFVILPNVAHQHEIHHSVDGDIPMIYQIPNCEFAHQLKLEDSDNW